MKSTGPPESIRVLLVDDHPVVRAGVRSLLAGAADIEVVGEAEDGNRAVDEARRLLGQLAIAEPAPLDVDRVARLG